MRGMYCYYLILISICFVSFVLSASDEVTVAIDTSSYISSPINPRFASYSYEYGGLPSVAGTTPNLRASFFQLMNNIKGYTGSSPQFRIGGNSADTSWWNPDKLPFPPKVTYNILPAEVQTVQDVTSKLDTVATLSVNFDNANNASWAIEYMEAVSKQIGWDNIYAIEIGNEVDLFGDNGFREKGYNYTQYKKEFDFYVNAIAPYVPKRFIQGATFCCLSSFFDQIPSYVQNENSKIKTLSVHNYPTTHCNNNPVELSELMVDKSSEGVAAFFAPLAKATITAGVEFWVGEMNSASCGGAPNVSDVFGSALWAVDILFNYVNIGVKGVNFHGGSGGYYTSFAYSSPTSTIPEVRPIYYGQFLFAQAIRANSRLIDANVTHTTNELVKVWAVRDGDNQDIRIVVVHKDITTKVPATVTIKLSGSYQNSASLLTVEAPSPYSQTGITIGGQTFDGTQTGAPVGNQKTVTVTGSSNSYSFTVLPSSIALLTVHAS